jgi:uncharacterized membrane protein
MQSDHSVEERLWAMLAYLVGASVIGPLLIYFLLRARSRFIAFHALQSVLIQLAMVGGMLTLGTAGTLLFHSPFSCIGLLILIAVLGIPVAGALFVVWAAIRAGLGDWYEVPLLGTLARRQVDL